MKTLMKTTLLATLFASSIAVAAEMSSPSPAGAEAYIISPSSGESVSGTFTVQFGLKGMGIAPAGTNIKNTGHHHLLIDTDVSTLDLSKPLPKSDKVRHFGGGQTQAELSLEKGEHTLQLLLGDYLHIPHNKPVMSEKVTIIVE
jgi:hypothetical protein